MKTGKLITNFVEIYDQGAYAVNGKTTKHGGISRVVFNGYHGVLSVSYPAQLSCKSLEIGVQRTFKPMIRILGGLEQSYPKPQNALKSQARCILKERLSAACPCWKIEIDLADVAGVGRCGVWFVRQVTMALQESTCGVDIRLGSLEAQNCLFPTVQTEVDVSINMEYHVNVWCKPEITDMKQLNLLPVYKFTRKTTKA